MITSEMINEIHAALGSVKLENDEYLLVHKHLDHIIAFKNMCSESKLIDEDEEQDWFSLSLGFFIAKGITETTNLQDLEGLPKYGDTRILACICRYDYHYWC